MPQINLELVVLKFQSWIIVLFIYIRRHINTIWYLSIAALYFLVHYLSRCWNVIFFILMKGKEIIRHIDQEFKKLAKNKLLKPEDCNHPHQTRACIFELTKIIRHFEHKFNYVPPAAHLLVNEYSVKQERMIFENYCKEFSD